MKKFLKIAYWVVLAVVAIFAILVIISSIPFPNGTRMYIVRSGSMHPAIHTGDLIFSKKQNDYNVNDVITFMPLRGTTEKELVTHRIVEKQNVEFKTKGDANDAPDNGLIPLGNVRGRYFLRIPILGYLAGFVKTVPGLIFLIVIPGTIIIYGEVQNIIIEIKKRKKRTNKKEKK